MIGKFSVRKPYTVLVGVILALVLGVVSFTKMSTDLLPNISLSYAVVMTTYPGASPEEVETAVTKPVESAMALISNIESIQSISAENYSMVILEFNQSANMDSVSLEIRESLDQITPYWSDSIGSPVIMKLNPDMLPVMVAAVGMENMDHGQVSEYAKEEIVPALENLEGVASVSASGLLEESVQVVIRQEKIDEVNEKIFAAIDAGMADAWAELENGREQLAASQKEIAGGQKQLSGGQDQINQGKEQLETGKTQLKDQQKTSNETLAQTKEQLLTAKSNLETTKLNLTTNLSTAKTLNVTIEEIDTLLAMASSYRENCDALQNAVSGGDAQDNEVYYAQIRELKKSFEQSTILQQILSSDQLPEENRTQIQEKIEELKTLDWTDSSQFDTVQTDLDELTLQLAAPLLIQKLKMMDVLNGLTNSLGLEAYEALVTESVKTIDQNLAAINNGLIEVEKGQMTAAIEFANANSSLLLGEYRLEMSQSQLDSARKELENGEAALSEAQQQIDDGEKQLEEAQQEAYDQADMNKLLTADMIKGILTAQNFSMPAGYITEEGIDYLVRIGEKPQSLEELQELPLLDMHMEGVPVIKLKDVADVFYADNSEDIYTNVNGTAGVILTMQKQTGYSTADVSDRIKERFTQLMDKNPDLKLITLMDQGIYIDLVKNSIFSNIIVGGILAVLILLLFLKDLRPTLVVAVSIPVSVVTAVVCMYFSGVTLNVISLSGLALGIGMLVDNSIVVIENIYRLRNEGCSAAEAAIKGTKEVTGAIVASTLTTICVFLPIVFTEGLTRQLFVDMGLTIAYSLLASLLIALTVVPAMSSKILVKTMPKKEGKAYKVLTRGYETVLKGVLKGKPLVFLLTILFFVLSLYGALQNGTAFMADMDSTQMTVTVSLDENASLTDTAEVTDQVIARILEIDEIQDVGAMAGSSGLGSMSMGSDGADNRSTIYVTTVADKTMTNEEIAGRIMEETGDLDAQIQVTTSNMDMSALGGSGISIQVRGRDLDVLRSIASQVADIVRDVEGTEDVSDGLEKTQKEIRIVVDKEKAAGYGLTTAQLYTQLYQKLAKASSSNVLVTADKDYDIYVGSDKDTQLTKEQLKSLSVDGTDETGKQVEVPLEDLVSFEDAETLNRILRADQSRYVTVSASIRDGYNIGLVSNALEKKLDGYELPDGYKLVFSGENETIQEAIGQVLLMLVLALIFVYLIMVAQFQSLLSPFIIMFTIPLAFTGGFLGLILTGSEISVIALIGFVMLSGIIVNNGIVLIDCINQLTEQGMEKREAIYTAGRTRLRPVLMTALTTILGLSAMVFSKDMGSEMARPMAVVTIGGLLYGTLLTLIVVPCIYDVFTRKPHARRKKEQTADRQVDDER